MDSSIRILLADDHRLVRESISALLHLENDMVVVASAEDGREAVALAAEHRPDVVIMDAGMPGLNGVDATRRILANHSGTKVLCLSAHRERRMVDAMLDAGVKGYLLKTAAAKELVSAVRVVAAGNSYLSAEIVGDVIRNYTGRDESSNHSAGPFLKLTEREREVLQLVADGHNTKSIALLLGIGPKTVLAHRDSLMKKLGVDTTVALARYALREGLSDL